MSFWHKSLKLGAAFVGGSFTNYVILTESFEIE